MSTPNFESMTVGGIEDTLERTRREMSATLAELAEVASPKYQAAQAKQVAQEKAEHYKAQAQDLWSRAKSGDTDAIKQLAIIGGVSVLVMGLIVYRMVHNHRR